MPRTHASAASQNLFGDDFRLLSEKLVDDDPRERAKALIFLDSYLDDCTRPIFELKRMIELASRKAMRSALETREPEIDHRRSGASLDHIAVPSRKRLTRKEEIAAIEELVGANGDVSRAP